MGVHDTGQMGADLRDAHCGLGLPQSIHFLFSSASFLISSCNVRLATVWSMVDGERGELAMQLRGAFVPLKRLAVMRGNCHVGLINRRLSLCSSPSGTLTLEQTESRVSSCVQAGKSLADRSMHRSE